MLDLAPLAVAIAAIMPIVSAEATCTDCLFDER